MNWLIATTNFYLLLKNLTNDGLISKINDINLLKTLYQIIELGIEFFHVLYTSINTFMNIMNRTLLGQN